VLGKGIDHDLKITGIDHDLKITGIDHDLKITIKKFND
jgi:hypothetical protein